MKIIEKFSALCCLGRPQILKSLELEGFKSILTYINGFSFRALTDQHSSMYYSAKLDWKWTFKKLWQKDSRAFSQMKELVLNKVSLAEATNSLHMLEHLENPPVEEICDRFLTDVRSLFRKLANLRSLVLKEFTPRREMDLNNSDSIGDPIIF